MTPTRLRDRPLPSARLILGGAQLAAGAPSLPGSVRGAAACALLDRALELGIRAVDTAALYQLGGSERVIGRWMRARNVRDRVYLISKGGHPSLLGRPRLGRRDLEGDLAGSLRRLRTDYVDLYLLHRDAAPAPIEPIAETLWSFVADGRIRAYGVSNWTHERFAELHALAARQGMPLPAASSPQLSLPVWVKPPYPGCVSVGGRAGAQALRQYRESNTAVLAWSPLGSGWVRAAGTPAGSRAYRGRANDERLRRVGMLAERIGCTPAQVALAYVLAHGPRVYAIIGTRRPERLAELQRAAALALDADQLAYLAGRPG